MAATTESYPTNSTMPGHLQVRHIVPATITTVTCVALILVIVVGLKCCALVRRQRILNFVGRTFSPSESQQQLPVKSTKKCSNDEFLSCSHKIFQTKVASDEDWDEQSIGSSENECVDDTMKCMEALGVVSSQESSSSNLHLEAINSEKCAIINPELLKKELEVEVEMHHSLFDEDIKTKTLLSKIARGSCSRHESEEDLCAGLGDPTMYPTEVLP